MRTIRNKNIKGTVLSVTLKIFNMPLKILDGIRNLICCILENLELFFVAVLFTLLFFGVYAAIYFKTPEEREATQERHSYEIYNAIKQSDRETRVLLIDITNRLERIEREKDKSNKDNCGKQFEKRESKDA